MEIKINTTKIIKLVSAEKLTDVRIKIYSRSGQLIIDELMSEDVDGVYFYPWTPMIIGNYTGKISCESIKKETYIDIDVVKVIDFTKILDNQKTINDGIQNASLIIPHTKNLD